MFNFFKISQKEFLMSFLFVVAVSVFVSCLFGKQLLFVLSVLISSTFCLLVENITTLLLILTANELPIAVPKAPAPSIIILFNYLILRVMIDRIAKAIPTIQNLVTILLS